MSSDVIANEVRQSRPAEAIGRCECCGIVDHHLAGGHCIECRPKLAAVDVRIGGRRKGARIKGAVRVEYDSARNPMIRIVPAGHCEPEGRGNLAAGGAA